MSEINFSQVAIKFASWKRHQTFGSYNVLVSGNSQKLCIKKIANLGEQYFGNSSKS